MLTTRFLEGLGAACGIVGSLLIASNTTLSPYGWIAFAISSCALLGFAIKIRAWGLLALQVCFCGTNVLGLWRWLISPLLA